jgi:DNA-binding MarR family transcriptional regulator
VQGTLETFVRKTRPGDGLPLRSTPEFENLSIGFANHPQLDWMMASASLSRASKIITSRSAAILSDIEQLSMVRYEILLLLYASDQHELSVKDLKHLSFLHPPTLTYTLDWLEDRELVSRRGNRSDRRSVMITITDSGLALFEKATTALSAANFGLVGLSADDARRIARSLAKLQQAEDG